MDSGNPETVDNPDVVVDGHGERALDPHLERTDGERPDSDVVERQRRIAHLVEHGTTDREAGGPPLSTGRATE